MFKEENMASFFKIRPFFMSSWQKKLHLTLTYSNCYLKRHFPFVPWWNEYGWKFQESEKIRNFKILNGPNLDQYKP